ncbi:hypothetical protein LTR85_007517 [Meristemomyces frigidus]|nr:hypothetical protein LTR85_007517 [Meristemomyces frigidus]
MLINPASIDKAAELGPSSTVTELERLCKYLKQGVRAIGFLDLPAELRNRINEDVVIKPGGGEIEIRPVYYAPHHGQSQQPAITRVCRQLRRETLPMYYAANRFVTSVGWMYNVEEDLPEKAVSKWLEAIGEESSKHIRHLFVGFRSDYDASNMGGPEAISLETERIKSSTVLRPVSEVAEVRLWTRKESRMRHKAYRRKS